MHKSTGKDLALLQSSFLKIVFAVSGDNNIVIGLLNAFPFLAIDTVFIFPQKQERVKI